VDVWTWRADGSGKGGDRAHRLLNPRPPRPLILQAIATGALADVNLQWLVLHQSGQQPYDRRGGRSRHRRLTISSPDKNGHPYNPSSRLLELCDPLHLIVFNDTPLPVRSGCAHNQHRHGAPRGSRSLPRGGGEAPRGCPSSSSPPWNVWSGPWGASGAPPLGSRGPSPLDQHPWGD